MSSTQQCFVPTAAGILDRSWLCRWQRSNKLTVSSLICMLLAGGMAIKDLRAEGGMLSSGTKWLACIAAALWIAGIYFVDSDSGFNPPTEYGTEPVSSPTGEHGNAMPATVND